MPDPDKIASTKFVIGAAVPGFDLLNFHSAAYRRAASRGVEFQQRPIVLRVWMAISAGIAIDLYGRSSSSLPVLRVRQSTARKHSVNRSAMSMSKMWQMYLCKIHSTTIL